MEAALPTLPPELWCKILSYASGGDVKSLAKLAQVCGLFRGLVLGSSLTWKCVVISPGRLGAPPLVRFAAQHMGPWTLSLSVLHHSGLTLPDFHSLLGPTQRSLRNLCLNDITFAKAGTEINVADHYSVMSQCFGALIDGAPALEVLELLNATAEAAGVLERFLSEPLRKLPRLRSLSLNGFKCSDGNLLDKDFMELEAVGARLVHLDLSHVNFDSCKGPWPSGVRLCDLSAATPALETLIARESFLHFLPPAAGDALGWQRLHTLDISQRCWQKTVAIRYDWSVISESNSVLLLFATRSPALTELRLNYQIGALGRLGGLALPSLRVLHVSGCVHQAQDGKLLRRLEGQLEELHIQDTSVEAALDSCFRESNATLKRLDLGFSGSSAKLLGSHYP